MEDNNKLFVFEKKEVILIFVFIVLIAVISFTLGVRTGKQLSLKQDDYTAEDIQKINLKSIDEENVDDLVNEKGSTAFERSLEDEGTSLQKDATKFEDPAAVNKPVDVLESRLKEEMEKLAREKIPAETTAVESGADSGNGQGLGEDVLNDSKAVASTVAPDYTGKYTIQLFSHQSQESAQDFADAFIIKGYDVIINEVIIPGKGKWYRVGIGAFSTINEAEDYLQKEKDLFQSQQYIIQKI